MELTSEQEAIIRSTGNISINAVAGSGKTTTIIEYAKARPANARILYIAFNKSVKLEAQKKFTDNGLKNVQVETAHSLAYKYIVFNNQYRVNSNGYKTNEIADLLNLAGNEEKHTEYVVANHINKFVAYFCNSNAKKVQDLNYLDVVSDPKAKIFVTTFYDYIEKQSRILLAKMNSGEIDITHDFYLKKFQLSNTQLPYDYILFDEGQDASPAMLDIFLRQPATKVIVGDTHQQIYGWRFAINSMENVDFATFQLSASFRFNQDIANLGLKVLSLKNELGKHMAVKICGAGNSKDIKTNAIIARTNLGLLLQAIDYVTVHKNLKRLYFEGNINSYTYADEGASLYDVLNLYNGKRSFIKDSLILAMKDIKELEDYIEKTEDAQLGMMLKIVKEYGNKIPEILKSIKDKHVENDEKSKAEMIFSTVHRCKGMEYDVVHLANDFITKKKIDKQKEEDDKEKFNTAKLNEEINLLYVAVTRTKNILHIPEDLVPTGFPYSPNIKIVRELTDEERKKLITGGKTVLPKVPRVDYKKETTKERNYLAERQKKKTTDAGKPWTKRLDAELLMMNNNRADIEDMAKFFGRTIGAITSRLKRLQSADDYHE